MTDTSKILQSLGYYYILTNLLPEVAHNLIIGQTRNETGIGLNVLVPR